MSGGQCQRVMIAIATACNPKLLIADEPTTALDVTVQKQVLDLLLQLQAEHGMALVLITHDMGVVAETADRVIVQYNGQKMEDTDVVSLFEAPASPYTRALLSALPENAHGGRLPTVPPSRRAPRPPDDRPRSVLEDPGITRDYASGGLFGGARTVRALKGIDLKVGPRPDPGGGRRVGCGKSTLARIITMIDPATGASCSSRARRSTSPGTASRPSCAARCRSSSRTPTAR